MTVVTETESERLVPLYVAESAAATAVRLALGLAATFSVEGVLKFDEVPFPGKITRIYHDLHWGSVGTVEHSGGTDLTWLQLYKIADDLINQSRDLHHSFIEGFYRDGTELRLLTGS